MDTQGGLKNLTDAGYVNGLILSGLSKLAHPGILDLAKYVLKQLSGCPAATGLRASSFPSWARPSFGEWFLDSLFLGGTLSLLVPLYAKGVS